MALRTAQYILDVNNSNDDSDSSGYRGIEPVVHYSAHPYDNNIGLHLSNLLQSTHEEAQSEISTHIYHQPEESNGNPNSCNFDTKCRLLITIGCLILIVSSISVTTVMLNSSKSDGHEVDLGRLTTRQTPCSSVLELGIGETKTVICSLPNVSANANSRLFIEKIEMNGSGSEFMMADLLFVKDRTNLIINFTFVNFQCTDEGNYSVYILQNGTLTSIHNISVAKQGKLDPFPLCQSSYNLEIRGSKEIKCSLQKETNENYSVRIEKVDGNRSGCMNAELQLEYSSDCYWYNIIFVFYAVTCNDSGNYSIGLMENGTKMRSSHNFSVLVQDELDPFPPCQSSYNLDIRGSKEINCSFQKETNENYSVCIEKVDGNRSGCMNAELQLEYSSDCYWYNIIFVFHAVTCNDIGNYSIGLMENGTMMRSSHNFSVLVQDKLDPFPLCQSSYNLDIRGSKEIKCSLQKETNENYSVCIEKVDGNRSGCMNAELQLEYSSDCQWYNIIFVFYAVTCNDIGNYSIGLMENGTMMRSSHNFSVLVQDQFDPFPLCQSSYNLDIRGSKEIKCSLQKETNENYNVCIEKVDGNRSGCMNAELQLEYSSDCYWYNIIFVFYDVTCNDSGNYSIGLMENGTMMRSSHNFSVLVQENLKNPKVSRMEDTRGYIVGELLEIECMASTGCSLKNLEFYHRPRNTSNGVFKENTESFVSKGSNSEYQVTTIYRTMLTDQSDGDVYTCKIQGTDISSDPYTVVMVEDDICEGKSNDCRFQHPTRCNLFVVCESPDKPAISPCPTGQYYPKNPNCETCCFKKSCANMVDGNCP